MATPEAAESAAIAVGSHETALCIVPPRQLWSSVDRLRALYDKAYQKWPPHVNLVYPFVRVDSLEKAVEQIRSGLAADWRPQHGSAGLRVRLDSADVFTHRHDNTIYIHDSDKNRNDALKALRRSVLKALGHKANNFQMHMTVAQSDDVKGDRHKFLLDKVNLLPEVEWDVGQLVILVRERIRLEGSATSCMKTWGTISLADLSLARDDQPRGFYEATPRTVPESSDDEADAEVDELQSGSPYSYDAETGLWRRYDPRNRGPSQASPTTLAVASYNVLAEFTFPPSQARYPLIIQNILSKNAIADVLVLQEASDDFLSYLLQDENIRAAYPFVSHGPPEQADVDPLPSLLNLVVLSKWAFEWEWVSFKRQHKGSVVVRFSDIGRWDDADFLPVVLATVHLTCGLTDGSVANKKMEVQRILKFLTTEYPDHPWILAGDFNISTSSFTLEAALKKNAISAQTAAYAASFDTLFDQAGLVDAWTYCRREVGDASDGEGGPDGARGEIFEGEQGATYDPTINALAAEIVGSGFNNRPQRYDRILVRGEEFLHIIKFNKFGFLTGRKSADAETEATTYPSDHWGVRCLLRVGSEAAAMERPKDEVAGLVVPVNLARAPASLSDVQELRAALSELRAIPTEQEAAEREDAFQLLRTVLLEPGPGETGDPAALQRLRSSLLVTPVGSYGLGVWTPSSDVDCMCIGPLSSSTFFALATLRLRKAAARGITILRRVSASSGTMLELEVQGIKMDLQYCPSAAIAENWPEVLRLPASDPVFSLSAQTLSKLKAARDLDYLRRSLPDPVKFRLAHRLIKTWAQSRGIYSTKFGYLGGFHISILLARVCKLVVRECGSTTVPDLVATFFRHYAAFDWASDLVFDPFFHKQRISYKRTAREPLAILGYYPPGLNTAQAASLPSVRTLAEEMQRADGLLLTADMTWSAFLGGGGGSGAADFLKAYKTYVKIDVQYWGLSLAKGAGFVGWLESRCVLLLVDINRRLPAVHARMWPARFVDSAAATAANDDDARDYQGCYLIGLDAAKMSREDEQLAAGALHSVLQRFEERIRGDERYFDAKSEWMGASVARRAELGELVVDARAWGDYAPGDDETDEEEDEEDASPDDSESLDEEGEEDAARKKSKKKGGKKGRKDKQATAGPKLEPGRKFRSAVDVISRLRWDPSLDSSDYIVGYEDRFVGARERALDMWKSEQTDEEFIPQHRVLYFKRKTDGVIVWERKTRIDEIFGSGV